NAWTNLGHVLERTKDYLGASAAYQRSLDLKRPLGDPVATSISLANLADVQLHTESATAARASLNEALALTLEAGAIPYVARSLWSAVKERLAVGDRISALRVAAVITGVPACEA